MSYASASALQAAVFAALTADAQVQALSGGAVHDALPPGPVPGLHVTLGPEEVRAASDKTGAGALHDFTVSVISDGAGFAAAKALAVAVSDVLDGAALSLARGHLVALQFRRARARRVGTGREIVLGFRARIDHGAA